MNGTGGLKAAFKAMIGWNRLSEARKAAGWRRYYVWLYRRNVAIATLVCLLPLSLSYVLRKSGSDKHQINGHRYGHLYSRYLTRLKYRRIRLLEIGIGGYGFALGGQSLNAWQAYFPFARIIGCDLEDKRGLATPGTRIRQVDQSSAADLALLARQDGPFDVIIDDGSHLSRHQIFTFLTLFDALVDGGVYVVEDVMSSYWTFGGWDGVHIDDPAFARTCVGWFADLARYVNFDEFESDRGIDPDKLRVARQIGHISFEKNLIAVQKSLAPRGEVAITRLRPAALARSAGTAA